MQNGDFRYVGGWTENGSCTGNDDYAAPADVPPDVPQLDGNYYKIVGNRTKTKTVSQTVQVSGNADDCFVLAGWAKGYSVPLDSSNDFVRHFAVRAWDKGTVLLSHFRLTLRKQ